MQIAAIEGLGHLTVGRLAPGLDAPPGLAEVEGFCAAYLSYAERGVFPGGCFFAHRPSPASGNGSRAGDGHHLGARTERGAILLQ